MYFCKMMKKIVLTFIALIIIPLASSAQQPTEPERLQPKVMASLSTVDEATRPEDYIAFYAIHDGNSLIGYLMEPKDDFANWILSGFELKENGSHALRDISLEELREAEQQMVDILNAFVDSAQEVHRCFTPPRFYEHGRQYLFYSDTLGHRCLHVTFYDYGKEDEYLRRQLAVCDGGDGFWQADFDLTTRKLKWFNVNGPSIYPVPGRSKETRGLLRQSRFYYWDFELKYEDIDEEELPEGAKTFCDQRLTKKLRRRSDGIYLYDIHNGPTAYFDKNGNFLALKSLYSNVEIDLEEYFTTLMPQRKTMLKLIYEDLRQHGAVDEVSLFSVERIDGKWLIGVAAQRTFARGFNRGFNTYYTFDAQGKLLGVDRPL